jgi:large subunit ribosomal protein L17
VTTEAKAKQLRPYVEKLITKARKGGLHRRRQALSELQDRKLVHRLFGEVAPRTGERPGGYTRILKLGPRRGDAAPMAIIELVDTPAARAPEPAAEGKQRRRRLRRPRSDRPESEGAESADAGEEVLSPEDAALAAEAEAAAPEGDPATSERTQE